MGGGNSKMAARATAGAVAMVKAIGDSKHSREDSKRVQWARAKAKWP